MRAVISVIVNRFAKRTAPKRRSGKWSDYIVY